jgi:hypothetical protein
MAHRHPPAVTAAGTLRDRHPGVRAAVIRDVRHHQVVPRTLPDPAPLEA